MGADDHRIDIVHRPVRPAKDGWWIRETHGGRIIHPARVVLTPRVMLPAENCERQGFLAAEVYALQHDEPLGPNPAFMLASSTGNLRKNEHGVMEGDGLYCFYPAVGDMASAPSLHYNLGIEPEQM